MPFLALSNLKTASTVPNTLRERENEEFRHCMDRAIEASSLRIIQTRHELEHADHAAELRKSSSAVDSSLSSTMV